MGKSSDDEARVLFKKSYTSYSKTCSTLSNQTRLLPTKRKISHHKGFYSDGGKVKRDLSIETEFCRVRRRFKNLLKINNMEAKSLLTSKSKSRYSDYTEIEPIEEFQKDFCGSGDSTSCSSPKRLLNKEDLLYNNLNALVKNWIQQVLDDDGVKSRIQHIFVTALQDTEPKGTQKSSSCTTYVLNNKNNDNKDANSSDQCCENGKATNLAQKTSSYILPSNNTIPILYKTIRLISTLSVPRKKKYKSKKKRSNKFKIRKGNHKKMLVTFIRPSKYMVDCSNTNIGLFEISTKSWMKGCVNVNEKQIKDEITKTIPITGQSSPNNGNRHADSVDLQPMSSLVDSFYEIEKNSNDFLNRKDQYMFCETKIKTSGIVKEAHKKNSAVKIDVITKKQEFTNIQEKPLTKQCENLNVKDDQKDINATTNINKPKTAIKKTKRISKYDQLQHKEFTFVHNKVNNQIANENTILKHLQEVFEYLNKCNSIRDMRLDLNVNMFPTYRDCTIASSSEGLQTTKPTLVYNVIPGQTRQSDEDEKTNHPRIIPLLDSAVSQAKYLLNIEKSPVHIPNETKMIQVDQGSMTTDIGVKQELNEIKEGLKHVSLLVHQFFPDQIIARKTYQKHYSTEPKVKQHIVNNTYFNRNAITCPVCRSDFKFKTSNEIAKSPSMEKIDSILCPYCKDETSKLLGKVPSTTSPSPDIILERPTQSRLQSFDNTYGKSGIPRLPTQPDNLPNYGEEVLKVLCPVCKSLVLKCSFMDYKQMISKYLCPHCKDSISCCPFNDGSNLPQTSNDTILGLSKHLCKVCKSTLSKYLPLGLVAPLTPTPLPDTPPKEFVKGISKLLCSDCKDVISHHFPRVKSKELKELKPCKKTPGNLVPAEECKQNNCRGLRSAVSRQTSPHTKHFKCSNLCSKDVGHQKPSIDINEPGPRYKDARIGSATITNCKDAFVNRQSFHGLPDNYSICKCPSIDTDRSDVIVARPKIKKNKRKKDAEIKKSVKKRSSSHVHGRKTYKKEMSPGIQISNRMNVGSVGLKFSKEGRSSCLRKANKNCTKCESDQIKKHPSYTIIPSESLIEVTDMTTTDRRDIVSNTTNIALTCSLPLAKSLFEISSETNKDSKGTIVDNGMDKQKPSLIKNFVTQAIPDLTIMSSTVQTNNTSGTKSGSTDFDVEQGLESETEKRKSDSRIPIPPKYMKILFYFSFLVLVVTVTGYVTYAVTKHFLKEQGKSKMYLKDEYDSTAYKMQLAELGF